MCSNRSDDALPGAVARIPPARASSPLSKDRTRSEPTDGAGPRDESANGASPPREASGTSRERGMDDDRLHQALDLQLAARLWSYVRPYRRAAFACLALSVGVSLLRLWQPTLIHGLIENEVAAGDVAGVARTTLGLLALALATFAAQAIFDYATGVVGQKAMHDLRMKVFRHVEGLDVAYFDRNPVGRLLTRMTSDISTLNELFASGVVSMLAELLLIAGIFAVMFAYSPPLTVVVLFATPLMILVVWLFRLHARRWYLEARRRLAKLNAYLQENVAGMRTVQSFNREARNLGVFRELNDDYRAAQVQTILGFALFYPAMTLISNFTLAAVVWIGGGRAMGERVLGGEAPSFATLFLFVQCVQMLFRPLQELSEKYNLLQAAMASSARVFRVLDTEAEIRPPANPKTPGPLRRGIAFENVRFEYVAGEPVLRDVSFELPAGATVAVVGATGSGKSTLINLMTRFHDPTGGRVLYDGTDVREFDPRALRRKFAVVLQDVFLFSGTIAGNLRLANPDLTDERVWDLLREVRADDFVRALPGGIDAPVGERAGTFSTGQKQLLAFARALAADPEVLVLDEATANVDTATERRIQEAIARMLSGRTALVVAHRLSTIRNADRILVVHHGQIRESGTHAELMELDGLYRRLHEMQVREAAVVGG